MAAAGAGDDEFSRIARLFRPLTFGAPEALDLLDDAALIPSRPGFDLVVTKDAMVAGVHFLPDDPLDLVARKLLRVNLSDLAAKGAEPYGWFLAVAWPHLTTEVDRALFAAGLEQDQRRYGLRLFGGDTVSTPGPLTLCATLTGWVPAERMVRRGRARAGDILLVSGVIGDGGLGLQAAAGGLTQLGEMEREALALRYRLPEPKLALRETLLAHASAAADVSDGLLADAGHIGEASALGVRIELDRVPLSNAASAWLALQPDRAEALAELASAGDDYEIVCAAPPERVEAMLAQASAVGAPLTPIGVFLTGSGIQTRFEGADRKVARRGWSHR